MAEVTQFALFGGMILGLGYIIFMAWRSSFSYVSAQGSQLGLPRAQRQFWQAVTRVLGPIGRAIFTFVNPASAPRRVTSQPVMNDPYGKTLSGDARSVDGMTIAPDVALQLEVVASSPKKGPKLGQKYQLASGLNLLGRTDGQGQGRMVLIQDDPSISAHHLDLAVDYNGQVLLTDRSKFGTWLNGAKLVPGEATAVQGGDQIKLGHTTLKLVGQGAGTAEALQIVLPPVYRFVVTQGPDKGKIFLLDGDMLRLGREAGLTDKNVSKKHVLIRRQGEQLLLQDEGSTQGTAVNGTIMHHTEIKPGDLLKLGKLTELKVELVQ
jgi:pSer/pThr/pTyr-binding forkhead associated (FHA) protein